ncbi:MAG TPA: tRNA-binding protein [Candidatus Paceibacterota bacterium]
MRNLLSRVHLRIGEVISVEELEGVCQQAYKLTIDFGPKIGKKLSSAQITNYPKNRLVGMKIICMTNVPAITVGNFRSEVVVCGFYRQDGTVVLAIPEEDVPNGYSLCT